ncbi:hypothetical protein BGX31_005188 [Mortierella sp. GBA43]|nr:hypothetical protein BGX31_005188 [Mortierella sp. GBA43]
MDDATTIRSDKESIAVDLLAERPEQGSSYLAYANVVCVIAGTGTLGLPYAFRQGGWIGVVVLLLTFIISTYTSILLVRCLYYNGKFRLSSYHEVGQHAFGRAGLIAVWFFHTSIILGAPIMYLILSGTEMKRLVYGVDISAKDWIWLCAAVVAVPFVSMRTLKEVAIMSVFGALSTAVLVIIAIRGSIMGLSDPKYDEVTHDFLVLANLPTAIASISFCYAGNVVFTHVEEAMRYPRSWNRVVGAALATCTTLYLVVAISGYFTYGSAAKSPVLANLPQDITTKVGTIIIIVQAILAAPIMLTSFALQSERLLHITVERRGKIMERVYRTVVRLLIIGFCGGIACIAPYFGAFLSLLGALGNCTLTFVLPILCYFQLFGWKQMRWYEGVWCIIIVLIGVACSIFGSIDAVGALITSIQNDASW